MLIARQRLDLLRDELRIPGRQLQSDDGYMRVDQWFEAKELDTEAEYLLRDIKGATVGIFDSIDLDFEVIDRSNGYETKAL